MTDVDRRTVLALLAAGVVPARVDSAARALLVQRRADSPPAPQFFTPEELALVDTVSELILPADARSPGARAARVASYIDLVVAHSRSDVQARWRTRLDAFETLARQRHARSFVNLDLSAQTALLNDVARAESAPSSDAERAFVDLKRMTLQAYYTTEIGLRRELGYRGPEMLAEFPGCPPPR